MSEGERRAEGVEAGVTRGAWVEGREDSAEEREGRSDDEDEEKRAAKGVLSAVVAVEVLAVGGGSG